MSGATQSPLALALHDAEFCMFYIRTPWRQWLNAVADSEAVVEFEPTHPTPMN